MKLVVGFIPFSATPDGLVVEKVYEMWKDKDFVLDLGTDPIAAAEEVRKLSPELTLYNALNPSWTYFVYPLKRLCLQIIRKKHLTFLRDFWGFVWKSCLLYVNHRS
jgi:hypothetical protein